MFDVKEWLLSLVGPVIDYSADVVNSCSSFGRDILKKRCAVRSREGFARFGSESDAPLNPPDYHDLTPPFITNCIKYGRSEHQHRRTATANLDN